ncbi:MAG TPA: glycoside hydrolase family 5 protein [Bacteroidota bacterium]|nr:glycoside hydrolase family 5 protein [Bacteroidota bacterium]
MKKILFLLLILSSISFAAASKFVTVRGADLCTPDGKPLLLRGINLGNWLVPEGYMFKFTKTTSPRLIYTAFEQMAGPEESQKFWTAFRDSYVTAKDIRFIRSLGLNSVRVPFNYRLFISDDDPERIRTANFKYLDRVIAWCRQEGLYVILDMHCAPGGQTGDNIDDSYGYPYLFESELAQRQAAMLWKFIAKRYAKETIVIGYDLLNEPIAHFFDTSHFNPRLEPVYKKIVAAIREADKNHICFLGGAQWDGNFSVFGAPFDRKLAYTWHRYWCDTTDAEAKQFIDFRKKYNTPIWLGESGENTDEWIAGFRRMCERNNIGWCFWPYKKMDSHSCMVSVPKPAMFDSLIAFADTSRMTFVEMRRRPSAFVVRQALNEYLQNCVLDRCTVNPGFLRALGVDEALIRGKKIDG